MVNFRKRKREEEELGSDREPTGAPEEEGGDIYEAERIMSRRVLPGDIVEYRIRWAGFGPEADSWEPVENLHHCAGLLDDFLSRQRRGPKASPKQQPPPISGGPMTRSRANAPQHDLPSSSSFSIKKQEDEEEADEEDSPRRMAITTEKIEHPSPEILFESEDLLGLEVSPEQTLNQHQQPKDHSRLGSPSKKARSSDDQSNLVFPNGKHICLAPISLQQVDKYTLLDTEDLVKRIKEYLNQGSISQLHFGESVLGLSPESVSDLLARPIPWSSLSQKGREPFIRMQMFLEELEREKNAAKDFGWTEEQRIKICAIEDEEEQLKYLKKLIYKYVEKIKNNNFCKHQKKILFSLK